MFTERLLLVLTFVISVHGLKVNIEGKLSLGKDVMDTLKHFFGISSLDGRRSLNSITKEDPLTIIVRAEFICNDLEFCKTLKQFLEEYVILLTKTTENIISVTLGSNFKSNIYETHLKYTLQGIKQITKTANANLNDHDKTFLWIDTIKKISGMFQELGKIFANEADVIKEKDELALMQKLVIATVVIEAKYINKLCIEHKICIKSHQVTKSLNIVLTQLKDISEESNKKFIKDFYDVLLETNFYNYIGESLAHQLQIILNDMYSSQHVSTKKLLSSVQEVVETRNQLLETNKLEKLSHDAHLLHAILSDMDHIYSLLVTNPFNEFIAKLVTWVNDNVSLYKQMRQINKDMKNEFGLISEELFNKLLNEVKVFLELTIG